MKARCKYNLKDVSLRPTSAVNYFSKVPLLLLINIKLYQMEKEKRRLIKESDFQ
jgi:hypothetical protein